MNILLVYPRYPDTFWSFKHALKFISKRAAFPPLGLLTVASVLPLKWKKKLIDMNTDDLKDADIAWADYVFLGAMGVQQQSVREVIRRCNQLHVKMVAGSWSRAKNRAATVNIESSAPNVASPSASVTASTGGGHKRVNRHLIGKLKVDLQRKAKRRGCRKTKLGSKLSIGTSKRR